jgi:hypothetical protein
MKFLTRVFAIAFLITGALSAQDFTGRWSGVADTIDEAGTKRMERHTIDIKMVDGKLTAMRMNRAGTGGSTLVIQVAGAKVNLYELLPLDGGEHLRWKLELKEDKLVGSWSALHDGPAKWIYDRVGPQTLVRVDPNAPPPQNAPAPKQ